MTVLSTDGSGVALALMRFTFGQEPVGSATVLIGGLQGLEAGADKRLIVRATRALTGLRLKDAALFAVQAVAKATRVPQVQAVSNATHVLSAEWTTGDCVISRDKDGLWKKKRGGRPDGRAGYLPLLWDYSARVAATSTPRLVDRHLDRHGAALSDKIASGFKSRPFAASRP